MHTIVCGQWNKHSSRRIEAQTLHALRNARDADPTAEEEFRAAENTLTALLLRELETAGVSLISDGSFRRDSVFDVARNIGGCSGFRQLTRIPDTNHFHRQPIATAELFGSAGEPVLLEDFRFARAHTSLPLVVCLPGPYSLALQTQNVREVGLATLAYAYASVLREEIAGLLGAGADLIRIEDQQILSHPHDWPLFKNVALHMTSGQDISRLALATWFEDVAALPGYFTLPFGVFFVDFVEGQGSVKALKNFPVDKKLVAGLFDARHPYRESETELRSKLRRIVANVSIDRVMLSANTDFYFLPWDAALLKVRAMVEFSKTYGGPTASSGPKKVSAGSARSYRPKCVLPVKGRRHPKESPFSIPFPTSAVGSYPQHREIRQARQKLRDGGISEKEYRATIERHVRRWMDFQDRELDMTCPVGGEFLREDMAAYFGEQIGGKKRDFIPSYENRRYRPIEYDTEIRPAASSMTGDDFVFLQSLTKKPIKETITGPATMADWGLISHPSYYFDRRAFRMGFAAALRKEIEAMLAAGVAILQIDEPALTTNMKQFDWDIEALSETIGGLEDKCYLILHICYSDMRALDAAFPAILRLPFQQIHMEVANRGYHMLELIEKYGFGGKDIGLGVIDVHTDKIETVDEVVKTIQRARMFFSPEQIWITPDCGLKERSDSIAQAKLRVMVQAARRCREELM